MKLHKVAGIAILALCTALIAVGAAAAAPGQAPSPPTGADWPTYGGNQFNQRCSALDQINKSNVKNLKGAWTFHTGYTDPAASFESTPVVVGGVMYVTTGRNDVFALDAKTGAMKWEYHPNLSNLGEPAVKVCCGVVNRGVAVGGGKVFIGRVDGMLVALDQNTGNAAWQVEVGSPNDGYSETMAPLYYNGLVIIGISGAEYETRGYVSGYNADTGALLWRWFGVPAPGEPGSETWPAGSDIWKAGGATVWTTPALDPDLGLVYVTTGNPGSDLDGSKRPGDNLYSDSIVALEAMTGKYRWHFQTVRHDIWDYDATSPAVLFDTTINGQPVKGLAHAGKTGLVYILDRTTGKPLIPIDETPVGQNARQATAATQPIPRTDPFVPTDVRSVITQSLFPSGPIFTPFEEMPTLILPGANGGAEWSPISYNPTTNFVYIAGINQPMVFTMHPSTISPGNFKLGSSFVQVPGLETSGTLTAMDVRTGKIAWQKTTRNMMIGGTTTTAGGLVFTGQGDGNFQAYDAQTGDLLWQFQTGAGANAAPSVYEVDGVEYVAIASGGNFQLNYPRGDTLWVFSLNGNIGPAAAPPAPLTTSPPPVLGEPVTTDHIDIVDFKFAPANVVVPVGTTVTWTQTGVFLHSATANDGTFDSGIMQTGQQFSFTFTQPGTFPYFCVPHPFMIGQIEVVPGVK
jgi:quinohemoprotein ethanol dehydrogenase